MVCILRMRRFAEPDGCITDVHPVLDTTGNKLQRLQPILDRCPVIDSRITCRQEIENLCMRAGDGQAVMEKRSAIAQVWHRASRHHGEAKQHRYGARCPELLQPRWPPAREVGT